MIFQPMQPGDSYVALIEGGSTVIFKAPSAFKAKLSADTWRRAECERAMRASETVRARVAAAAEKSAAKAVPE